MCRVGNGVYFATSFPPYHSCFGNKILKISTHFSIIQKKGNEGIKCFISSRSFLYILTTLNPNSTNPKQSHKKWINSNISSLKGGLRNMSK